MTPRRLHEVEAVVADALAKTRRIPVDKRAVVVGEDVGGLFANVMFRAGLEWHLRSQAWRTKRPAVTREQRLALLEMADAVRAAPGTPVLVVAREDVAELLVWGVAERRAA
jgi:hypothetical protein